MGCCPAVLQWRYPAVRPPPALFPALSSSLTSSSISSTFSSSLASPSVTSSLASSIASTSFTSPFTSTFASVGAGPAHSAGSLTRLSSRFRHAAEEQKEVEDGDWASGGEGGSEGG